LLGRCPGLIEAENPGVARIHPDYPKSRPGTFGTGIKSQKLNYLILSPALQASLEAVGIDRHGSYHPHTWTPFDTVSSASKEASDHHLLWADQNIGA
jgi:hypothetical protein